MLRLVFASSHHVFDVLDYFGELRTSDYNTTVSI